MRRILIKTVMLGYTHDNEVGVYPAHAQARILANQDLDSFLHSQPTEMQSSKSNFKRTSVLKQTARGSLPKARLQQVGAYGPQQQPAGCNTPDVQADRLPHAKVPFTSDRESGWANRGASYSSANGNDTQVQKRLQGEAASCENFGDCDATSNCSSSGLCTWHTLPEPF